MTGVAAQAGLFDPGALLGWLAAEPVGDLVLACGEHPDGADLRVDPSASSGEPILVLLPGCVAREPRALIVELLAAGAARVLVAADGCAAEDDTGVLVDGLRDLLAALGQADRVLALPAAGPSGRACPRVHHAGSLPVTRRTLLGRPVPPAPAVPGSPAERLAAAVVAVSGSVAAARAALAGVASDAIELRAPGCCGHGACARACPESALTVEVTELGASGSRQHVLEFDPARCTGCRACLTVCPVGAMTGGRALTWAEVLGGRLRVHAGLTRTCRRCGGPVDGAGERCGPCRGRAADPFGSRLPPGFTRPSRADASAGPPG